MDANAPPTSASHARCNDSENGSESVVARYEKWVQQHSSLARHLESMLYIAPQFVPKSVSDPEVSTQAGYSMVGLLGLYHDYILHKASPAEVMTIGNKITRVVRVPLSVIGHIQVLAEVIARKYGGEASRWRLIVWIEMMKAAFKLVLLMQQRRALLLGGGKYKGILPPGNKSSPFSRFTSSSKQPKRGARTGKVFGANKTAEPQESNKTESSEKTTPPTTTVLFEEAAIQLVDVQREHLLLTGELLHIIRPVAFAMLRRRRGETSWLPALVAVLIESASFVCTTSSSLSEGATLSTTGISSKRAAEELASRKMALLLYLLRDPVYASVTKPVTEAVCGVTDYVPLLGRLVRLVSTGILDYYHNFHFYTSAS
ncbi:hypothetical protein PINS_up003855 [Pythium insidiosum]|nr:hypothetical protein PINS_up003855 [Pythium insidiosum]